LRVILVPFGSHGDVHPFVGLGKALMARGHHVTCLALEHFGPLVREVGFEHVAYGDSAVFEETLNNPDLWHPRRSFDVVAEGLGLGLRPIYEAIAERYVPGETVVVAGTLAFGARIAQEKLGVPTATVHLQPSVFRTEYDAPLFAGLRFLQRLPRFGKRLFCHLLDRLTDHKLAPAVNAFRAELGLSPARSLMFSWVNSPQRVLGLFPDWFGPAQPDWPPQTVLTGFPLFDETGVTALPEELTAFLGDGDAPIIFTPGSAMKQGHTFFEAASATCRRLKRRGIFLTRFPEQIPASLPDGVRHFAYAPFSQILPRAAALVHHGGIGTSAQAMAAGAPQLVMPLAHDQFDNADRMERLGIARALPRPRFTVARVTPLLEELITSTSIAANCRTIAAKIKQDDPLAKACHAIETIAIKDSNLASAR
jgi:rhamnosyltransferase subunit B